MMFGTYWITQLKQGLIRLQIVGDLGVQAVNAMILELQQQARQAGDSLCILVDLSHATNPTPVLAHGCFIRALRRGCTSRVAVYGASPLVNHRARVLIQMARADDHVHFFGSESEALDWLAGQSYMWTPAQFAARL